MKLIDNPFYILKCLPESNEKTILEQVKSKSSEIGEQLCFNSKDILLNPSKRLEAEVSWFPGFGIDSLTKRICIVYKYFNKYISNFIFIKTNNYLAEANLLAFGLENEKDAKSWSNEDIRLLISYLCKNSEKINIEDIKRNIELSRSKANFPLNITNEQLSFFIEEQKKYYKQVLFKFIIQIDSKRINKILTDILNDAEINGESNCYWSLYEQVINDYESYYYDFFQKQKNIITQIIDKMSNSYELSSKNYTVDEKLDENLILLNNVAEPIKTLKKTRGQNFEYYDNIYYLIRELYLKASNEFSNYNFSNELIRLCKIYFYDLKNLCVLIEEDRKDLDALIYQESNKDVLFYAWGDNPNKKSIKTDDSSIIINNDKIIYYNHIIKYKFSKPEDNGSTLSVICKHSKGPIQIKIPNKEFSEKLKDMLMKKVATLLTFDYLDLLKEGNELQFGKLVFNDYGIKLPGKSFFINNTKSFTWNEIKDISFENNEITIIGPGSYKISESLDADYNLEVLKLMLIVFKSRGLCGRFSENL